MSPDRWTRLGPRLRSISAVCEPPSRTHGWLAESRSRLRLARAVKTNEAVRRLNFYGGDGGR